MNYELMLIFKPELGETEQTTVLQKIKKIIGEAEGGVVKEDSWGRRNLAYPIGKFSEGFYYLFNIHLPADEVSNLERVLRFEEDLLRFLITRLK